MREYKLRKAETDKEFLECTLCFEDRVLESEMVVCEENIEHKFCSTCVRRYIDTQLSDGTRVTSSSSSSLPRVERNILE